MDEYVKEFEFKEKVNELHGGFRKLGEEYLQGVAEKIEESIKLLQEAPSLSSLSSLWSMVEYHLNKKRMPEEWRKELMKRVKLPHKEKAKLEVIRKNALATSRGEVPEDQG